MTIRGQVWVSPVLEDTEKTALPYQGVGQNMPQRRYRVVPGSSTGGSIRVLTALAVPLPMDQNKSVRRLALVLATDPLSSTAEHAFYLIETQFNNTNLFADDVATFPKPFLGGHVNGGSTAAGGLGSVKAYTVTLSPCGRRLAWSDTDGRIAVMTMPMYWNTASGPDLGSVGTPFKILPKVNELGEPMDGSLSSFKWSPGGRYLAVNHPASNEFDVITIVDCGSPISSDDMPDAVADIVVGRAVQVTPSRFNSNDPYWGVSTFDLFQRDHPSTSHPDDGGSSTTVYYLTDRDVENDSQGPWGTREPLPHFKDGKKLFHLE
jgi:hypothetical protein